MILDDASKLLFVSTVKKDTAAEIAKKREQERQRQEKLEEVGRYRHRSNSRSLSPSPPRYMKHPSLFEYVVFSTLENRFKHVTLIV
jgi:hypothetical protein